MPSPEPPWEAEFSQQSPRRGDVPCPCSLGSCGRQLGGYDRRHFACSVIRLALLAQTDGLLCPRVCPPRWGGRWVPMSVWANTGGAWPWLSSWTQTSASRAFPPGPAGLSVLTLPGGRGRSRTAPGRRRVLWPLETWHLSWFLRFIDDEVLLVVTVSFISDIGILISNS